jgi:hypothetical protein
VADTVPVCGRCYAKAKIGNVNDSSIQEIWNSEPLLNMRKAFKWGRLPRQCKNQLCPVVVGRGMPQREEPRGVAGLDRQGRG